MVGGEPPVVTSERFAEGLTYEQFRQAAEGRARERLEANDRAAEAERATASCAAAFRSLPQPLNVVAIAEPWCRDVQDNLPLLAQAAARSGGMLRLRVFPRDANRDIMAAYRREGRFESLPVFVFFDDEFREVGRFVERPASVTDLRARRRRALFEQRPELGSPDTPVHTLPDEARAALSRAMTAIRDETQSFSNVEVLRELTDIARRAGTARLAAR